MEMMLVGAGGAAPLGEAQKFQVNPVPSAPPGTDFEAVAAFQFETSELARRVAGAGEEVGRIQERLRFMRAALLEAPRADPSLHSRMDALNRSLDQMRTRLFGDRIRGRMNEPSVPSISGRLGTARGLWDTRMEPTATMRRDLELAATRFAELEGALVELMEGEVARLEEDLAAAGAPWTPGQPIGWGGE